MISDTQRLDVELPLLASLPRPLDEAIEASISPDSEAPINVVEGAAAVRPSSADPVTRQASQEESSLIDTVTAEATADEEVGCEDGSRKSPHRNTWEDREVPASAEPFYFVVPPLSKVMPQPASVDLRVLRLCPLHSDTVFALRTALQR